MNEAARAPANLFDGRRLVIAAGPGGVGKTTTAAALAVVAARRGRRVLVSTIDPAPRLMDALAMPALGSEPSPIDERVARALGIARPELLRAARLDTEKAFARLVEAEVPDPQRRRRIHDNILYRQITRNLTGAAEHAATMALHELMARSDHDLLILDTPPTANALDFIETPRRLTDAIASPTVAWLMGARSGGLIQVGGALLLRRLAKLAGSHFLEDVGAFLTDFRAVLTGFAARASSVDRLLRSPVVSSVLVLAPDAAAVDEALIFHRQLIAAGLPPRAFVVNRVISAPPLAWADTAPSQAEIRFALDGVAALRAWTPNKRDDAARALAQALPDLESLARAQAAEIARLAARVGDVPLLRVPLVRQEAGSLEALAAIADALGPTC